MANPMKGEVPLGDLTLAFNWGALCALETKIGKKGAELISVLEADTGFSDLRDFIWAGLLKYHPKSEEDVLVLLDDIGFNAARDAVGAGIRSFFGEQEAKDENPQKAA